MKDLDNTKKQTSRIESEKDKTRPELSNYKDDNVDLRQVGSTMGGALLFGSIMGGPIGFIAGGIIGAVAAQLTKEDQED